jgi:hypothetical protein
MRNAKRNTRQHGKGAAPVPMPIMLYNLALNLGQDGTKAVISWEPFDVRSNENPASTDDMVITGIKSTATFTNTADGSVWSPELIEIQYGNVFLYFPDGSNTDGEGELRVPAFDPAYRTKTGGWTGPIYGSL